MVCSLTGRYFSSRSSPVYSRVAGGPSEKKSELFFVPSIRTPARSNVAAVAQIGGIETQAEMLRNDRDQRPRLQSPEKEIA